MTTVGNESTSNVYDVKSSFRHEARDYYEDIRVLTPVIRYCPNSKFLRKIRGNSK